MSCQAGRPAKTMIILVTGSSGFIGRNLIERLTGEIAAEIYQFSGSSKREHLRNYAADCDFVYHLAAVHRPADQVDYTTVNVDLLAQLLDLLRTNSNNCPVLLSSSIQADDGTLYGKSKRAAEKELLKHAEINQSEAIIYRLTNTFGRYARPNQHSVVATFCHNIARGLPVEIHEPGRIMRLYYIDDVVNAFLSHLEGYVKPDKDGFYRLPERLTYEITLQDLAEIITGFKADYDRGIRSVPSNDLAAKLFATFLSYIP
jgi:UDP-2-acetamido-2,6-beta-L-arabino-hexul-4-ose reductase